MKIDIPGYDVPIQIDGSINPTWYEKLKGLADAANGGGNGNGNAALIPRNVQNNNYTCVLSDTGKFIYHDTGSHTFAIPANAIVPFEIGTPITFMNVAGGGVVTITCGDTMILMNGGPILTGNRSLANYGIATALKIHQTGWVISGSGLT